MTPPAITVISTGLRPPAEARRKCLASVAAQFRPPMGPAVEHLYLDAAELPGEPAHFEQLTAAVAKLPDDRIVVSLDADDWLGPPAALCTVARAYAAGAWLTYGSFRFADGRRGCPSEPYAPSEDVRRVPWKGTHLKTFRAGLFKRIDPAHLRGPDGAWLVHARDLALMFPMLEMAGPRRCVHLREELYVYNYGNSTEYTGPEAVRAAELDAVRYVRSLPPYEALP